MKYFTIEEIVDERTFKEYGHKAWQLFPPDSLEMLDNLREFFDCPVTCNDWLQGGQFQFRGYRPAWCNVGTKGSAHRKGMAFDLDVEGLTAEQARIKILGDKDNPLLKHIKRIEGEVNWLHIDTMPPSQGKERIYVFSV
jgi:hypothetical protein